MENIKNQLKEINEDFEIQAMESDIDQDIGFRKKLNGNMPLCINCTKGCKVPFSFDTIFTCFTYSPRS